MSEFTTVQLRTTTRDELAEMGHKNESYDVIMRRLIVFWKEHHGEGGGGQ